MLNLKKRATDMKIMLIGMIVILFIVFLGFYPRIKRMKKRKDGRSSVEEFHNNYIERRKELQDTAMLRQRLPIMSQNTIARKITVKNNFLKK